MVIWYLARGAGITAFAALSLATALGAFTARRSAGELAAIERRVVLQYVHRAAAMTGLSLIALHVALILADSYAHVGWLGAIVPLQSGYRPVAIALGTLALYGLVAVAVTGMLRSQFTRSAKGSRRWRQIHLLAYPTWALAAGHFLLAGTDSAQLWARLVLFGGIGLVALGVIARLTEKDLTTNRVLAPVVGAGRS